jgi:polysaccharide chain length determinant protein (PEP-CTERM system associated)
LNVLLETVVEQARGAWRFRKLGSIVAWTVAVLGWLVVLAWPNSYEASARVFVDASTALRPVLQGLTIDQDVESQMSKVRESLLGRTRLERVARQADLDLDTRTPAEKDYLIAELQADIEIQSKAPGGRERSLDSVYTITYRHENRDKALAVVRSLLDALMEDTLQDKREGSSSAQEFLVQQIADYEARLSKAEAELAEFKKRNVGLVPGEQGDYFSRLQSEMVEERRTRAALDVAVRKRSELQRQRDGELPFSGVASSGGAASSARDASGRGNDTASRIAETQAKLDDLLLRFTDRHPDIAALRETLAQLKQRQQEELEALKRGDATAAAASGLASNPVYQSIQLQINQTNVEIAALQGKLAEHQRTQAELRKFVNTAPEVEAEFARLTRDYEVEKAQYNALVERLEKARLGDDAAGVGLVDFQVINPPMADTRPAAPVRPPLLALVFVAAIGLGVLASWVASQLRPVFTNARSLVDATGVPVLGSVSRTWRERHVQESRRGQRIFAASAAGLCIVFVAVVALHSAVARVVNALVSA